MIDLRGLPSLDPDDLVTPEVGAWAVEKYRRVWYYDQVFSTAMKNRWDQRVYLDLYSGAGMARIRETDVVVPPSPILALMVDDPFTKYVFCEQDPERLDALRARVERVKPDADVTYVSGDVNERIDDVIAAIPPFGRGNTQLSFCFVDPFSVDLRFETIRALGSGRNLDFLILLALGMDANRNVALYLEAQHERIEHFLGDPDWRRRWTRARGRGESFIHFLARRYITAMETLGYEGTTPDLMYQVRSDTKNLGLYYLAFFSKHPLGRKLWKDVLHYTEDQLGLGL